MQAIRHVLVFAVLLFLSGCGLPTTQAELKETAEAKQLMAIIGLLQAKDIAAAKSQMDPQLRSQAGIDNALGYLASLVPPGSPKSSSFGGWWVNLDSSNGRTSGITAELEFGGVWLQVLATFAGEPKSLLLTSYNIQTALPLADGTSPFTPQPNQPLRIINLLIALATTLTSLIAVVLCFRTPGLERKWLWAAASLLLICGFTADLSTGNIALNFIDFGGFDTRWYWLDPALGPILHVAIPVGAIVFLMKRRRLKKSAGNLTASENTGPPHEMTK